MAPELAYPRHRGLEVRHAEEDERARPSSPPCIPPEIVGVEIRYPPADGPGSIRQPNNPP